MTDNTPPAGGTSGPGPAPAPVKAAPAARRRRDAAADTDPAAGPAGPFASAIEGLSDAELDELAEDVRLERLRRGRRPHAPSFGLSEGERQDLVERGVTTSPFSGERMIATDHDVEPGNPAAERAAERAARDRDRT
jgi:hypothetical protein